jgi:hypothetical protein
VCGSAIEVDEFEIVVETENPVPCGTVVVVNTAKGVALPSSVGNRKGSITGSAFVC